MAQLIPRARPCFEPAQRGPGSFRIDVEEGQRVEAGDVVAKVGNNANSRAPHVHVGAWVGETPLQIQVDLYAAERHAGSADQDD